MQPPRSQCILFEIYFSYLFFSHQQSNSAGWSLKWHFVLICISTFCSRLFCPLRPYLPTTDPLLLSRLPTSDILLLSMQICLCFVITNYICLFVVIFIILPLGSPFATPFSPFLVVFPPHCSFYHFYALPTLAFAKSFFFFCYLFPVLLSCLPIRHFNVLLQSCLFVILILTCVFFFSTLPLSTAHQWWHFSLLLVFFTLWDGLLNSKSVADGLFLQYHSWFVCSFSFAFQNLHLLLINSALSPQAKKA